MKKIITFLLIVGLFSAAGCKKKSNPANNITACGVQNPVENLPWLKAEVATLTGGPQMNAIVLYSYNGKEVIEIQGALFSSTNIHQYYCDGTKLSLQNPTDFNKFKTERLELAVVYGTKIW